MTVGELLANFYRNTVTGDYLPYHAVEIYRGAERLFNIDNYKEDFILPAYLKELEVRGFGYSLHRHCLFIQTFWSE